MSARIAEHARARPNAPAIVDRDRLLTYEQLEATLQQTAIGLRSLSSDPDRPIAICARTSLDYAVAVLAAYRAGRPIAELNPQEDRERTLAVLARIDPLVLMIDHDEQRFSQVPRLLRLQQTTFGADGAETELGGFPEDRLASIVFTSGTTGEPKGVMLSHLNLRAVTAAILEQLPLTEADRYCLTLPLCHTYGKSVLLTTLHAGGTVLIERDFNDLVGFTQRLAQNQVTVFSGVPFHLAALLKRAPLDRVELPALRRITTSGSHVPPSILTQLAERFPEVEVVSMYGLSESATRVTVLPAERLLDKPGSVGRALGGVQISIQDAEGKTQPVGVGGEVCVRGPNVMLGYWNDRELSDETLRGGWLHTRDLGHLDAEGFLYLSGRTSDLIKCAGERVSAVEIEQALATHPGVLDAAAVAMPHPLLGEAVHAWIVRESDALDEAALREHCARLLTSHKIPRRFSFVDELPRTSSGKVQKGRLGSSGASG